MDGKRCTPSYIIIKMPNIKDKGRIVNVARGKKLVTYREVPIRLPAGFLKRNFAG